MGKCGSRTCWGHDKLIDCIAPFFSLLIISLLTLSHLEILQSSEYTTLSDIVAVATTVYMTLYVFPKDFYSVHNFQVFILKLLFFPLYQFALKIF